MSSPEGPEPVDVVLTEIRRLQTTFDAKIRYDETKEHAFDTMSKELADHRQGLIQAQLRTVLLDLVAMYDDLTKLTAPSEREPSAVEELLCFRESVEQMLARQGVETFAADGPEVDRARQKVIGVVETTDRGLDRHVAERVRTGFSWQDRVLRPEWVKVYAAAKDTAPAEPVDPPEETTSPAPPEDTTTPVEQGAPS